MKINKKITLLLITLFIIAVFLLGCNSTPDKKEYKMWHLNSMNIDKLWSYSKGDSQIIAVIDSGISNELYDQYKDNIILKYNIIDNSDDVTDNNGHGSEMASLIIGNGYMDMYGVAPNVKLIIIKVVDEEGVTNYDNLNKALVYAIDNGATIINISLGGTKKNAKIEENINKALKNNITIVSAAGDYQEKDLLFPANVPGVISVEAINRNNELWHYSNHSKDSTIAFPGEEIKAISYKNNENILEDTNGTSQATAIASGYISLLKDYAYKQEIELTNEELINILSTLNNNNLKTKNYETAFIEILKYKK